MLCAGILLFVASHWDDLAPSQRFLLVLAMVGVFHVAAAALGQKVPSMGIALHVAGTASLGGGIYMQAKFSICRSIGPAACCCGLWVLPWDGCCCGSGRRRCLPRCWFHGGWPVSGRWRRKVISAHGTSLHRAFSCFQFSTLPLLQRAQPVFASWDGLGRSLVSDSDDCGRNLYRGRARLHWRWRLPIFPLA